MSFFADLSLTILAALLAEPGKSIELYPHDDLSLAFADLTAGTEVALHPGTYEIDGNLTLTAVGTTKAPVRVFAEMPGTVLLRQATDRHNVLEIRDSRHLVLSGLSVTGGSHGIRLINSDFITIEDNEIYLTGDVGLSANAGGTYEHLTVRRNHIHHTGGTGEGMYLGCNWDRCRVANSVIEDNYVHHTDGSGVTQGDGIELKEGSFGNLIRRNRIHDTRYPGILVYGTNGNGAANIIERNVVWAARESAVQIAADAVFRNNVVLGSVLLQPHQSARPANIRLAHNTIIGRRATLTVRDVAGEVLVVNNAIYSRSIAVRILGDGRERVLAAGNVGSGRTVGLADGFAVTDGLSFDTVAGHYRGRPPINVKPRPDGGLINAGDPAYAVKTDLAGCTRRDSWDAGALRYVIAASDALQNTFDEILTAADCQ